MDRKEFMYSCGMACLGTLAFGFLLPGCVSVKMITAVINGPDLLIPLNTFVKPDDKKPGFHAYIIAQNESLKYPICIYRHDAQNYSALLMRCTHQGTELQAFGDRLQCPAHGSEFTNKGEVQSGPASTPLRTFPIIIEQTQLRLSLK
ncbi:MAG: QcrA and Rieske domain-containing protein [Bacteroidia bacterium]